MSVAIIDFKLHHYLKVSRLSWKWRKRSSVKIAELMYEKRAQTLPGNQFFGVGRDARPNIAKQIVGDAERGPARVMEHPELSVSAHAWRNQALSVGQPHWLV